MIYQKSLGVLVNQVFLLEHSVGNKHANTGFLVMSYLHRQAN